MAAAKASAAGTAWAVALREWDAEG